MAADHPISVFIHGAGSNAGFWHEQRAAFPGAHFPNLPGHYDPRTRRATSEGLRSIDEYADWVEGYVSNARLNHVVLNGHSMGGAIVLALALRTPDWLRAIVLTGTGARLRVNPQLLDLLRTDYPAAVDYIMRHSFAQVREPLSYAQKVRLNGTRRQLERTPQSVTLGDYEACEHFDVMDRVGEIRVPALCIVGTEDEMTPPRYSEYLSKRLPGARLVVIEGGGHMLPLEQPATYNAALADFAGGL